MTDPNPKAEACAICGRTILLAGQRVPRDDVAHVGLMQRQPMRVAEHLWPLLADAHDGLGLGGRGRAEKNKGS